MKLFGTDGIRGIAGEFPLDPRTIESVGRSLVFNLTAELGRPPSIVIGRDEANGVHVAIPGDPYVSRRHAEIIDLGGAWGIRDLGSTNGTKLNGLAMVGAEVKLIKANDVIELGCFSRITVRDRSVED